MQQRGTRRLSARARKAVLAAHIVSAGAWIGIDVVLGVVVFTAMLTGDPATAAIGWQALRLFAVWPLLITGAVCLASGVVLGLGTKYGLVRYWWVAVKLVLNVVLMVLVAFALRPGVDTAADYGRRLAAGDALVPLPNLFMPPIVSSTCLLVAVLLSVFKPWGRIRRGAPARGGALSRVA
ncbi:hypothetical protein [Saccharopolyspora taberi]|uniref:Membrane protein n=1 Tax=Saccharopolyspora taberi TaxID=60895 RepID=A0ABN3V9X5_9PSEU